MRIYTFLDFGSPRYVFQNKRPKRNAEQSSGGFEEEKKENTNVTQQELQGLTREMEGMAESRELQGRMRGAMKNFEKDLNENTIGEYTLGISSYTETGELWAAVSYQEEGTKLEQDIIKIESKVAPGRSYVNIKNEKLGNLFYGKDIESFIEGDGKPFSSMPEIDRQLSLHKHLITTSYPHLVDLTAGTRENSSLIKEIPKIGGNELTITYEVRIPDQRNEKGQMQFKKETLAQVVVRNNQEQPELIINGVNEGMIFGDKAAKKIIDQYQEKYGKEQWDYEGEITDRIEAFHEIEKSIRKSGFKSISFPDRGQISIYKAPHATFEQNPDVKIAYQPETWTWGVTINDLIMEGEIPRKEFQSNESEEIEKHIKEKFLDKNKNIKK